jgi:hypothetical protein
MGVFNVLQLADWKSWKRGQGDSQSWLDKGKKIYGACGWGSPWKKEEVGVGRGTPPSIHRGDNFSSQQLGSKQKLEGCKPSRLLQISDWGVGHYYSTWKVEWSTKFKKPKKCEEFYSWVVSRYPDLLAVRAYTNG